jgi:hypothetical protein
MLSQALSIVVVHGVRVRCWPVEVVVVVVVGRVEAMAVLRRRKINGWYHFDPIAGPPGPVTIFSPQTIFHERHTQTYV